MSLARGNALALPLASSSVDMVVTSPPYFALRSYTDGGEHYDGQIGSEATPAEFIAALVEVTRECVRVLKPSGSLWVNLGDKYARNGGSGNGAGSSDGTTGRGSRPLGTTTAPDGIREKSLMGLPWRYALACIDDLGLILRAEVIWSKPNGLPESVQDRVRRSHEQWFHFTREPRYFSAVDEIRDDYSERVQDRQRYAGREDVPRGKWSDGSGRHDGNGERGILGFGHRGMSPLGKLPGSVWTVPTEPLRVPAHLPQHFAAFPSEWPKRIILGWSPSGICVECGEGRRPVVDRQVTEWNSGNGGTEAAGRSMLSRPSREHGRHPLNVSTEITGESCACPTPDAPTRPAVVLDPFCGTGTTVAVANALGRYGIGLDLSADYLKVARWRCSDPKLRAKVLRVDPPAPQVTGQLDLLETA